MSLERRTVQLIEIDLDYCTRTYGTAPCTASLSSAAPAKCFNMFFGCQDKENFDKGVLTLRYAKNQTGLPPGTQVFPALRDVSTSPVEINLGGLDERTSSMGKRARLVVDLQDFVDNDTALDKYQAERRSGAALFSGQGYDPEGRGSHFGRLRARCPYYVGRALRVLEGYEGQALSAMQTRHFEITEWTGPDLADGRLRITARDILDRAEDDTALCPKQSQGELAADIAETGLAVFDLEPPGIGDEYDASGRGSIGSEIFDFTRSGDRITMTARALDGTEAESHSQGDVFQMCFRVDGALISDVAETLLVDFAGLPASAIPSSDWADEEIWLGGLRLTRTLARPTGVMSLMAELGQLGVQWWPDDGAQKIRMRVNRPVGPDDPVPPAFSDALSIKRGSLTRTDLVDQRVTQALIYHGQIDATGSADDGGNYTRVHVGLNDGGGDLKYGREAFVEIRSPWLGEGNNNFASITASRYATRFENPPVETVFSVDAKDRDLVTVGFLITLESRAFQGADGASVVTEMLVVSREETIPRHEMSVKAVSFEFLGRFAYVLANGTPDYDLASDADKEFGCFLFDTAETDFGDGTGPYLLF